MRPVPAKVLVLLGSLLGLPFLGACLGDSSVSGPPDDDPSTFLVFISDRAGTESIHRVDPDGSQLRQITGARGLDTEPDCAAGTPDLVFTSVERDGPRRELYFLNSVGSLRRLTVRQGAGEEDYSAAWSPDGQRIAFITSGRGQFGGAANRLATMNTDGSVVEGVGDDLRGVDVDWSPAGHGMALASEGSPADGDLDLFVVDEEGNARAVASDPSLSETEPAWSGADDRVAFTVMSPDGSGGDIYTVRADGSDLRQLTTHGAADRHPTFSPDGSRIAFASDRSGNFEIYVMDADGSDVRQVTGHPDRDVMPTWCSIGP